MCWDGASVTITVPHPRHEDFLHDATHVRAVTVEGLSMFSRKNCDEWTAAGSANTPLAYAAGVDFEITESEITLEEPCKSKFELDVLSTIELLEATRQYNNVLKETKIVLRVLKGALHTLRALILDTAANLEGAGGSAALGAPS